MYYLDGENVIINDREDSHASVPLHPQQNHLKAPHGGLMNVRSHAETQLALDIPMAVTEDI